MSTELTQKDLAAKSVERADFGNDPILSEVGLALAPASPFPSGRERLLRELNKTSRFERFVASIARALGIARELAERLLGGIDREESWTRSRWPGVRLYHLEEPLGDADIVGKAVVGFLRLSPGTRFPLHRHHGEETVVVVQGELQETDGTVVRAGDTHVRSPGSEHEFVALPGPDLIFLAVVRDGASFGSFVVRPGSPEG